MKLPFSKTKPTDLPRLRQRQMGDFVSNPKGAWEQEIPKEPAAIFLAIDQWVLPKNPLPSNGVEGPNKNATIGISLPGGHLITLTRAEIWILIMRLGNKLGTPEIEINLDDGRSFKGLNRGDYDVLLQALRTHPDAKWQSQAQQQASLEP